ncbi:MAG: hypothetical protein AB7G47_09805 [Mycolicibacterium sp.]|uniref:hypothetical protein n=1 Tax=Mycolicibacterium sp. TaxID=2320850 RepID=UPI003D121E53
MTEVPDILDVGMGMEPAQVGHGFGELYCETLVDYLSQRQTNRALRAAVQDWNGRSLRVS